MPAILGTIALAGLASLVAATLGAAAAIRVGLRLKRTGRKLARESREATRHTLAIPLDTSRVRPLPTKGCGTGACSTKGAP